MPRPTSWRVSARQAPLSPSSPTPASPTATSTAGSCVYVDHHGEDLSEAMLTAGGAGLYDSEPTLVRASEHQLAAQDAQDDARGLWDAC